MPGEREIEGEFGEAVGRVGPALLIALDALEGAMRRLHPPDFDAVRERLRAPYAALVSATDEIESVALPEASLASFRADLLASARLAASALQRLVDPGEDGIVGALAAMHEHARSQAALYPLRLALPPVSAVFAEPIRRGDLAGLEARDGATAFTGRPSA